MRGIHVQGSRKSRKYEDHKSKKKILDGYNNNFIHNTLTTKDNEYEVNFNTLNFLYTNIDTYSNKKTDLQIKQQTCKNKPNIIILTEINAKHYKYPVAESELQINDYNLFITNLLNKDYRGIAVYVDNKVQSMQLDDVTTFNENILLKITNNNKDIIICCIYRSPNSDLINDMKLYQIINRVTDKYKNVIIIGDFNYPHINWTNPTNYENFNNEKLDTSELF